jgi:hypothetical protein
MDTESKNMAKQREAQISWTAEASRRTIEREREGRREQENKSKRERN